MAGHPFYQSSEWKLLRKQVRANWKRTGKGCGVCGQRIKWNERPVVDHIQNRRKYPELALHIHNLQMVCHPCNSKKAAWSELSTVTPTNLDGFPSDWGTEL